MQHFLTYFKMCLCYLLLLLSICHFGDFWQNNQSEASESKKIKNLILNISNDLSLVIQTLFTAVTVLLVACVDGSEVSLCALFQISDEATHDRLWPTSSRHWGSSAPTFPSVFPHFFFPQQNNTWSFRPHLISTLVLTPAHNTARPLQSVRGCVIFGRTCAEAASGGGETALWCCRSAELY